MRTTSLRRRVAGWGLLMVALVLLAVNTVVFTAVRAQLLAGLAGLADERATLARELADEHGTDELASHLADLGIPATVTSAEGTTSTSQPASLQLPGGLPAPQPSGALGPVVTTSVSLPGGGSATVMVRRAGVDHTLRVLALTQAAATVAALLLGWPLLGAVTRRATRPLDDVAAAAGRIAAGQRNERLRPDRADTEVGALAHALDRMLDALDDAVGRAEAAEARSQRFLADAAHQLRTPLAAIAAAVDTLLRRLPADQHETLLADLARESDRAARLAAGLLRLARLDEAASAPTEPVELAALVREEADRITHRRSNVTVTVDAANKRWVRGNPADLAEAVANLLDNAARHAASQVRLTLTAQDGMVRMQVHDDGPGVPAGDHERIFDRFATSGPGHDAGLGLPIARAVAHAHAGDLRYDGEAFTLTIPALS